MADGRRETAEVKNQSELFPSHVLDEPVPQGVCQRCGRAKVYCECETVDGGPETGICENIGRDGVCNLVGTEYCDWSCPHNANINQ